MIDTTIIYYTASTLREPFATKVRDNLWKAKGNLPLISVSQKPLDFGENILFTEGRSTKNIYKQILIGAKAAKTHWVTMAEDDTLYSSDHLKYELPADGFWYDMARWSIYSWTNPPQYSIKYRISMSTAVCTRELLIDLLERRFAIPEDKASPHMWSEPGKHDYHYKLGRYPINQFTSHNPCVVFSHPDALGYEIQGELKRLGELKAYDIPYWGKAEDLIKNYYQK